ncbi:Ditrans,polycis-undecaprenyl-diphosphate synthase ((2E,6E)-farnesyl-diphosphate specific) [Candidatus Arcanobacter lacustris]|uniref:Isoprenyl transferase n=1 Tax=Candidatus Arcanibacter lacustris TaxID=1607817 RepID=A0A0F5MMY2_9RICK|nr:Ditrans,polycis-undecaprenyl-diphosphate synthase ((2E,6E)-farnesyl-diphosphate specific) [Candidatus Arcanobacter lacustris]KKB96082.1 Ditrans,polycis-undecaprenyl-diphosphate synthase ((2E,6E)-farnesyl-diphosphate specific) [Candidatus Arcanobacter lacustris]
MTNPKHVAIILDGNGRWAESRGLPRIMGHKKGAERIREILKACIKLDIPYLTLYVFSIENWDRPTGEVKYLMDLLSYYLKEEIANIHKNNVKLKVIGNTTLLHEDIQKDIEYGTNLTKDNQKLTLNIALSYSGREEILMATKKIAQNILDQKISIDEINEAFFAKQLYTDQIPDPDLLIRTSGEQRLSNFLLWQLAYTELFFTNTLWPDFSIDDFLQAINNFKSRERRYGKTK